ncbi:hypothetical protein ACEQ8H_004062 [Pleosporales sp. CAS-2024a]
MTVWKLTNIGYELIADACRLEDDAQALLVKFKIEEHRLLNWGKLVQLDYTEEQLLLNHMSRGMIMDVLHRQQRLLASFGRLNKRYGKLTRPLLEELNEPFSIDPDRLIENGGSMSEARFHSVQFPLPEELVIKALNWLKKSRHVPKRIRWASWDHGRMESLIEKLSDFNVKMHEALDKAQMEALLDMQTRFNYQMVLLNKQMENMVHIWQSDRIAHRSHDMIAELEDSDYDLGNGIVPFGRRRSTQRLGALAQQKFVHLAIQDSQYISEEYGNSIDLPHLADNIRETEIPLGEIIPTSGFPEHVDEGSRTEATYQGASVWIEWKPNEPCSPSLADTHMDPKIRTRCVSARPIAWGTFVDDLSSEDRESRFGLVFEKPAGVPDGIQPTTLRALMEASNAAEYQVNVPSLTDRIVLMRLLSETIERLHAVDWLHKGLRSSNILFFPAKDGSIDFADPHVSGFDYSRPATSDDMTERPNDNPRADIYRHPHVQSTGNREESAGREIYKKSFDVYSLGIVLLEIAHWKTIEKILQIDLETARPKQTWPVMERLVRGEPRHLGHVKSYLGNTIEGVIRACLEGPEAFGLARDADERRGVVAAALQKGFGELVVRKLAGLKGL